MSTGYTTVRAAPHEEALQGALRALRARGIDAEELPVNGHEPDIRLDDGTLIDIKTSDRHTNLAVELNSVMAWKRLEAIGQRLLILHRNNKREWYVDTPTSLFARCIGGPNRPSGNGSNDDYHIFWPGGTPVNAWFGPRHEE